VEEKEATGLRTRLDFLAMAFSFLVVLLFAWGCVVSVEVRACWGTRSRLSYLLELRQGGRSPRVTLTNPHQNTPLARPFSRAIKDFECQSRISLGLI
jgi:hypothetical protein